VTPNNPGHEYEEHIHKTYSYTAKFGPTNGLAIPEYWSRKAVLTRQHFANDAQHGTKSLELGDCLVSISAPVHSRFEKFRQASHSERT
jgi:hypothetical protein